MPMLANSEYLSSFIFYKVFYILYFIKSLSVYMDEAWVNQVQTREGEQQSKRMEWMGLGRHIQSYFV